MVKLVWRVKLVAELGLGAVSETEVAMIERENVATAETVGLTLDEGKRLAATIQAEIVRAQVAAMGEQLRCCGHCGATSRAKVTTPLRSVRSSVPFGSGSADCAHAIAELSCSSRGAFQRSRAPEASRPSWRMSRRSFQHLLRSLGWRSCCPSCYPETVSNLGVVWRSGR